MFLSTSIMKMKPSPTLQIAAKAKALQAKGVDIIDLSVGEPDADTPDFIKQAAITALQNGETKYTPVDGTPLLKKAIVKKFQNENDLPCTPEQIHVSNGAKQVIFNALLATLNEGDEVIIPAPYWVSYPDITLFAGGKPVIVPCHADEDFKITPDKLATAITRRTKWFILNSPSNPTGSVYTRAQLWDLAEVLKKHPHVWILSDDIYEHLIYDQAPFETIGSVSPALLPRTLTVNGVSKAYAMTGWRIGFGMGPLPLIQAMRTLQSQSTSNPCSISQSAAQEALSQTQKSWLKEQGRIFQQRRDFFVTALKASFPCRQPGGAFYLYPSCAPLLGRLTPHGKRLDTDEDVADYLLEAAQVTVVPGSAFGLSPYLRLSYAVSSERLKEAAKRMSQSIEQLR